jgi:hypothetical protein
MFLETPATTKAAKTKKNAALSLGLLAISQTHVAFNFLCLASRLDGLSYGDNISSIKHLYIQTHTPNVKYMSTASGRYIYHLISCERLYLTTVHRMWQ